MTAIPLSDPPGTISGMFRDPRVAITAVITGGVTLVVLVLTLGYLAINKADAGTILSLVATAAAIVNLVFTTRVREAVQVLREQTNGTQTKLVDAVIASPPPER